MDQIGMVQVTQAGAATLEGSGDDTYWSSTTSTYYTVYTYDDLNQLTSAITYPGTYDPDVSPTATSDEEFSFNAIGNLVSDSTGTYSSNDMNEYTGLPSGATIIYNGRGDTTQVGDTLYGYDALDRLVDMQPASPTDGSLDVRYTYDAENRLIQKQVYSWNSDLDGEDDGDAGWNTTPDTTTGYLYDGTEMIGEINVPTAADVGETGYPYDALQETFTWNPQADGGVGGLLSETVRDGSGSYVGSYAPEYDGADNIVGWVDESSGQVVETQTFSAFGIKTVTSDTAISIDGVSVNISSLTPFGFQTMMNLGEANGMGADLWIRPGGSEDENRVTSSTLGRWLQPDAIGVQGGANLYEIDANAPTTYVDPDSERIEKTDTTANGQHIVVFHIYSSYGLFWAGEKFVGNVVANGNDDNAVYSAYLEAQSIDKAGNINSGATLAFGVGAATFRALPFVGQLTVAAESITGEDQLDKGAPRLTTTQRLLGATVVVGSITSAAVDALQGESAIARTLSTDVRDLAGASGRTGEQVVADSGAVGVRSADSVVLQDESLAVRERVTLQNGEASRYGPRSPGSLNPDTGDISISREGVREWAAKDGTSVQQELYTTAYHEAFHKGMLPIDNFISKLVGVEDIYASSKLAFLKGTGGLWYKFEEGLAEWYGQARSEIRIAFGR